MLRSFVGVVLSILLSLPAMAQAVASLPAAQNQDAKGQPPEQISVSFDNVLLQDAIRKVANRSGRPIGFATNLVPEKRVTYSGNRVALAVVLREILKGTGIRADREADGSYTLVKTGSNGAVKGQGVIVGKVTDAKTGNGMSGASVSLDSDTRGVTTGEDGMYRVAGVSAGTHSISVRMVGYAKQTRQVTVGEGATATADFKLEPTANVLDQVIVTGTAVATELKAVPTAMTIVTAKQIQERGITKIDQLFRGDVPGLFAVNQGSNALLDEVMMFSRGGSSLPGGVTSSVASTNPIKTYVDGVEMANPAYLSQIDPKSIERIEILSGPQASTIYGSNAINGVMQIFTKRGTHARPQLAASLMSGVVQNNFATALTPQHDYSVQLNGVEGRAAYNVGGSWYYIGPWTPAKKTSRFGGFGGVRSQAGPITADISARVSMTQNRQLGATDQTTSIMYTNGVFDPSGALGAGRAAPATSAAHGQTFGLTIGYNPTSWWSHEVVLGSDASRVEKTEAEPLYLRSADTLMSVTQSWNTRSSQRYTNTLRILRAPTTTLTATFGVDHWQNRLSSTSAKTLTLTGSLGTPSITRGAPGKNTGGFVQGQFGLYDKLFLTYGLRAEWNPNYGAEANPNLAPRYGAAYTQEMGPVVVKARGSYGRATRPPTETQKLAAAQYILPSIALYGPYNSQLANPDLGPEFQQGGEGGLEWYFGSRASFIITRYNQTVDGLIERTTVDSIQSLVMNPAGCTPSANGYCYGALSQYLNIGSVRNQGWELQGSTNAGPLTVRGTYSWTKSRLIGITPKYRAKLSTENYAPGYSFGFLPEHTWSAALVYGNAATTVSFNVNGTGFMYRFVDDLFLATQNRLMVYRPVQGPSSLSPARYRRQGAGYQMADVNASHRFSSKIEGILQIQNLTNFYQSDYNASHAVIGRQTKAGLRVLWR